MALVTSPRREIVVFRSLEEQKLAPTFNHSGSTTKFEMAIPNMNAHMRQLTGLYSPHMTNETIAITAQYATPGAYFDKLEDSVVLSSLQGSVLMHALLS